MIRSNYLGENQIINFSLLNNYLFLIQMLKILGNCQNKTGPMKNVSRPVIIGSYPYKDSINVSRLICEYTGIPYENQFFNPCTWRTFKEQVAADWDFPELPFLIDGDLVVTQAFPICEYLVKKSGHVHLLGAAPQDSAVVDSFLWGKDLIHSLLSVMVENKNNPKKLMEQVYGAWGATVRKQLLKYQALAIEGGYYLGYLTVIDFLIYEIVEHYKGLFRSDIAHFPRLVAIWEKIQALHEVKMHQCSQRAVTEMCPLEFYKKFKMEKLHKNSKFDCQASGVS